MINEVYKFLRNILKDNLYYKDKTYFVGGCVRDYFRDQPAHDIDIVINQPGGAKELVYLIYNTIKNKELITTPYNLGHYPIWSITFKNNFEFNGQFFNLKDTVIEIAETMSENFPDETSRQREVNFATLEEDIMRRDFSINSGLIDVITFEFKNLAENNTLNDIKNHIIRCNKSNSLYIDKIFCDDPLRILRGCVFAARFSYKIDNLVKESMRKNIDRLSIISRERINSEIKKALDITGGLYRLVKELDSINGLEYVFPQIEKLKKVYQWNIDEKDGFYPDIRNIHLEGPSVFDHVLNVIRYIKKGYELGLAALYHDAGKLYPEYKNGKVRFINHEVISGKIVERLFPELKIDNETIKNVKFLVENHMLLHRLEAYSKKSIRKFIRTIPTDTLRYELYDLCNADCLGTLTKENNVICSLIPHTEVIEKIEILIKEDEIIPEKPFRYFNGNELMEMLNIKGRQVGVAIEYMLTLQDEYGFNKDKDFIKNKLIEFFKKEN